MSLTLPVTFGTQTSPLALSTWDTQFAAIGHIVATNLAEVRTLLKTGIGVCFAEGRVTAGDGGGGWYTYVASDTTSTDNGGTILVATDGGRWYLSGGSGVVSLSQFQGADPTGATDSSSALIAALAAYSCIDMRGGTWLISASVTIPSNRFIDMRGAQITLACGGTAAFQVLGANSNVYFLCGGATVIGTASAFLYLQGSTTTPSSEVQYARQIRIEGLYISSTTITAAIQMANSVRKVFLNGCVFFTVNGITSSGKTVEVFIENCLMYGSVPGSGAGIKIRATNATYYAEGWSIVGCTIDGFAIGHDIADIFVYQVTGGYHGMSGGTLAFQFQQTAGIAFTNDIELGGGIVIAGNVSFLSFGSGWLCKTTISNFHHIQANGAAIAIASNASAITIRNGKFTDASPTGAAGVAGTNNNANIVCENLDFDATYASGVVLNGANGTGCVVGAISGPVTGDPIYIARPVRIWASECSTSDMFAWKSTYNAASIAGTITVSSAIASISINCAVGESGYVNVELSCSGMNASTQFFTVNLPAGLTAAAGTGWSSLVIYPNAAQTWVAAHIPVYCTADIAAGTLSITNSAGNSVVVQSHSRFGFVKDW